MVVNHINELKKRSQLGKKAEYATHYNPKLLFAIPRQIKREEISISEHLPFYGLDIWNAYEVSWLNAKGKPMVAIAEIHVPCESTNIFESKSLKLYLNSFNSSHFDSAENVAQTIVADLSNVINSAVTVDLQLAQSFRNTCFEKMPGHNIDSLDIETNCYQSNPDFLSVADEIVTEELNTDLLKSNCLVTNQPDWGSVYINYQGKKINHEGLLKYIISLREHNEFHEQCVERIFMDIQRKCHPESLTVYARYTRRGGIDINPFRTTEKKFIVPNCRLARQ